MTFVLHLYHSRLSHLTPYLFQIFITTFKMEDQRGIITIDIISLIISNRRTWQDHRHYIYTQCLRKNCAKLFLSELCQISINCTNFWLVDGKMAEIIYYIYIFHVISLMLLLYFVKHKSTKFHRF